MPLLGAGVLAIWNGIAPGMEAEFVAWHVREHIPERVGVPGFLRGRRYVALDGAPAYFNFYETESPDTLTSPGYLARLDDPTPWTRKVVARFTDTSRTVCDAIVSLGRGEGGAIETLRLRPTDPARFTATLRPALDTVLAAPGIVGVHLLQGRPPSEAASRTAEKSLRDEPDLTADWILLIEAIDAAAIHAARTGPAATTALERHGAAPGCDRGLYQLQFSLRHPDA